MNMKQNEPQFNFAIATAPGTPLTMSSREIAELCEKNHAHVLRDIRKMLIDIFGGEELNLIVPEQYRNRHSEYIRENADAIMGKLFGDDPNVVYPTRGFKWARDTRGYISDFWMNKDLTVTLITGYRADLRYRVVKRLEELETRATQPALPDFSDPVVAARAWADALERKQAAETRMIEAQRLVADLTPKAEAYEAYLSEEGVCRISDFCNKHGVKVNRPGYILRAKGYMHQKKALATQSGLKTGILKNVLEKNGFEYIDAKGQSVESQLIMIVRQRETDLLKMIVDAYGETAFRNPAAFLRAKNSLTGG